MSEPLDADVLLARAYLSRVGEPASVGLWLLVDEVGPVEAVRALRAGRADVRLLAETEARRIGADPEADLAAAERHGLRLVVPESREWPHFAFAALEKAARPRGAAWMAAGPGATGARTAKFSRSESGEPVPPLALWVRGPGELATLGVRSVGIVGARAATAYGEHVTAELGYGLARRDVTVVSGGAYGIDAAAHRAALGRRRPDRRRVGRRTRPAVPAGQRDAVRPGCRDRAGRFGEPAGMRPATAPLPHPQPADRRAVDRGRGGRGRRPIGRDEHRRALPRARPAADGGARPGHLGDVGRLSRVAPPRSRPGRAGDLGRRRAGRGRVTPARGWTCASNRRATCGPNSMSWSRSRGRSSTGCTRAGSPVRTRSRRVAASPRST